MKKLLLSVAFLIGCNIAFCNTAYDSLLVKLNTVLDSKKNYDSQKLHRIDALKKSLRKDDSNGRHYELYLGLYNEYKSFNYDEAFNYSQKLLQLGRSMHNPVMLAYGKLKLAFIMLSSGMFKETCDSLKTVNVAILPDSAKREYYLLNVRTYYDLADYDRDKYFTPEYIKLVGRYIDSATNISNVNSFEYLYYKGLKCFKSGQREQAIGYLEKLIADHKLTDHQFAITTSTLGDIYGSLGQQDRAIELQIQAAMADVRSSTKEAAAMLKLAQLLHNKRDNQNAYVFIKEAMNDAIYYGARQRKMQVSAILPVIASETINSVEEQRHNLFLYSGTLTVLALVVVTFAVIIYKQLQKIKVADAAIIDANHNLQLTINKLDEANTIKDEYIGYYFNLISEYISKLEKFKQSVENKVTAKKFDDIRALASNINLSKEREELYVNFDKAFLKIFPRFVSSFNALFTAENQVKLQPNQLLNTDLRIFALIRLGITDTEKIANILEYSVNTIYNYKARIKSKSIISNEEFENAIMAIRAI